MSILTKPQTRAELGDRLRDTYVVTAELLSEIVNQTCRPIGQTARIEQLIPSGAWTGAALALIDLELPQWQLRRIVYDGGEWQCALSRERELPDWLDRSVEAHHADLPLAILSAFIEAERITASAGRGNVPIVPRKADAFYEPILSDNFA